jgi:uncharacterized protein (TIGR00251 family)
VLNLTFQDGAVRLSVKVVPGASRTRYLGEWDGRARIAVAAPPEKGKANQAVVKFLAELLGADRRDIAVVAGLTNPLKTIRIESVSMEAVRAALEGHRS